jgi:hypothetical protein
LPLHPASAFVATILAATCATSVRAQWVTFVDQTATRLVAAANVGSADPQEKDYAWADFDQDGDVDLVVVRKSPATTAGHFPNVLLMNENGVLTDRTAALASAALIAGSQGMLDATNDRDVVAVDVNGDGWLDLVTATTLTLGNPQYIRVPRVYINRGDDLIGNWLGFIYDDPLRIDDTVWQGGQRFCSVAAGDIDLDGDMDLYFGDYQQPDPQTRPFDVNDRLLLNNGAGYFTDVSAARMSAVMLESSFAMKVAMVDMNLDGKVDILKDDALNAPQAISISYNDGAAGPGHFRTYQLAYGNAPYHFAVGDLNNDSLPDIIVSDDGADRYKLHTGVVGGVATFGPELPFTYTGGGGDDGFGGNNLIVDLNNDGWKDVIVADFDVDLPDCTRRCHIFRNLGNAPDVTLQEQQIGSTVCGIPIAQLRGTFDVAVFDIDGDGANDLVIGTCNGTKVWINQPPAGIALGYPAGRPSTLAPGAARTLDVHATGFGGVVPQPGTGRLWYSINGAAFTQVPMADLGPGQYRATLPALPNCADRLRFYVGVDSQTAVTWHDPPTAPAAVHTAIAGFGTTIVFANDFETPVSGWSVVNHASLTSGAWEVAIPIGTNFNSELAAPDQDGELSPAAVRCWVTQNGVPNGGASAADVDGGPTDLISPPLDLAGTDGLVRYTRWFYSSTSEDTLLVQVSNDGLNWATVESVGSSGNNSWVERQFRVGQYVTPNATVRVRFRTADTGAGSVVEAGVDVFQVQTFACAPCQQQFPLPTTGNGTMSMCGGDLSPNTAVTLRVVNLPSGGSGLLVFDLPLLPTPWLGGTLMSPAPTVLGPLLADASGVCSAVLPIGGLLPAGWALHAQAVYPQPGLPNGVGQTNAVRVQW